jgi:hypothetical protein
MKRSTRFSGGAEAPQGTKAHPEAKTMNSIEKQPGFAWPLELEGLKRLTAAEAWRQDVSIGA